MKKILVVVDMQKDFIDGALGTREAVAIVPGVIEKIEVYKEEGSHIYFTQDTHQPTYLKTQEGRNLPVEHCIRGTDGWELQSQIKEIQIELENTQENSKVFEKEIFGSEELVRYIRDNEVKQEELVIEMVGLCTDICVLSNAILCKTFMPEATVQVDASCCAGVTPETHRNALNAMKMCQIKIINE